MSGTLIRIIVLAAVATTATILVRAEIVGGRAQAEPGDNQMTKRMDVAGPWDEFQKPPAQELEGKLDDLQYQVTQECGTEPPFRNKYWDNHEAGIYVDVVSGEPLFSSLDKFESGSGWPSFTRPLDAEHIEEVSDHSLGMRRTEVRSTNADSHLGHLFNDGPAPTGMRYCINSASLRFVPVDKLEEEGYGDFLALFQSDEEQKSAAESKSSAGAGTAGETAAGAGAVTETQKTETATLAGGCFWGMEDILRDIPGVLDTEVGFAGGTADKATYNDVKTGSSGHAESVQIVFDPDRVSYEEILGFFFRMHDPTTLNRQGNDRGTQYRSAIFVHSEAQRETAERVKAEVDASGKWKKPIVTEIAPAGPFHAAEDYHQDYLEKNPNGYTCHYLRD